MTGLQYREELRRIIAEQPPRQLGLDLLGWSCDECPGTERHTSECTYLAWLRGDS